MILTEGLCDHSLPDFRDKSEVIARLSQTLPILRGVENYLRNENPARKEEYLEWTLLCDFTYFAYWGPGSFSAMFGAHVAVINPSIRYGAFVRTPLLQAVYLPAIRSIVRALGGHRLVLMPDTDSALGDSADCLRDGKATLDECVHLIKKAWG
jgi:hypothetical protein